jgi:hypothetical protein
VDARLHDEIVELARLLLLERVGALVQGKGCVVHGMSSAICRFEPEPNLSTADAFKTN